MVDVSSDIISDLLGIIQSHQCSEYGDNIINIIHTNFRQDVDFTDDVEIIDEDLENIAKYCACLMVKINKLARDNNNNHKLNKLIDMILLATVNSNNSTVLLIKIIIDNFMILSLHQNNEYSRPSTMLAVELIMRCILECISIRYQSNNSNLLNQNHTILFLLLIANQDNVIYCNFTIANKYSKHHELAELRKNKDTIQVENEKIIENIENLLSIFNTTFQNLFSNYSCGMKIYLKSLHLTENCTLVASRMLSALLCNLNEGCITNIFIEVGKFWHELENTSNVDIYIAHLINSIIDIISKSPNHELSSASIASILPICLRLCNRYSVNEQILGLRVLQISIERLTSSSIVSISSWLLPQLIACLKFYTGKITIIFKIFNYRSFIIYRFANNRFHADVALYSTIRRNFNLFCDVHILQTLLPYFNSAYRQFEF